MNPGGDAAEQVVRLSLEGVEVAARITGNGAKNIALLLMATLKQEQRTKGKARLTSMLRTGKELKVYTITNKDLKKFSQEAKRYGVLYCVLKDRNNTDPDAAVDVIARAEDASKIQRITERFRLATVDKADVTLDRQRDRDVMFPQNKSVKKELRPGQGGRDGSEPSDPELALPAIDEAELAAEGRNLQMNAGRDEQPENPSVAKTARDPLSEPSYRQGSRSNGSRKSVEDRPSVKEKLNVYKAEAERLREKTRETPDRMMKTAADAIKKVPVRRLKER